VKVSITVISHLYLEIFKEQKGGALFACEGNLRK